MDFKKLSIIIPVYNEKNTISEILKKVEKRINSAFTKAEEDKDEEKKLSDFERKIVRQAVEEETNPLDEFLDSLVLFGFYVWAFNIGGNDFLHSKKIPLNFDLRNERVLEAIRGKTDLLIQGLDGTTKNFLADKIITGIESGLTKKQVADSVREVIPETYASRAKTVAYTEMSNMVNAAEIETAARNGAIQKRWLIVSDDLVCFECEANEDEGTINIHDYFHSGHIRPPVHPNCRCMLEFETINLGYYWNGG